MAETKLADISEFQESFDAAPYLRSGHQLIIIRTHNGYRPDKLMPARRNYVRQWPFVAIGYYQYVVKDRDAAQQAREYIATVGGLRGNEFAICDLEEGAGNQTARANAWFAVVDPWAKLLAALYSGESFLDNQLGGPARWGKRPLWIAAYPNSYTPVPALEPRGADWWQYSDRERFPGLPNPVDGSIYHGTAQQFLTMVRGGAPPPPIKLPAETESFDVATLPDGRQEVFVELKSGEVTHRWNAPDGGWVPDWHSLGTPG